tara:strand:- start:11536 stop:13305 length:1770 start_codon:yes stop_codon:yes gene_type:complete
MSVAENSKFIALVADNGTEFTSEQKAIFTIHPDIGFIKGKDSYLSYDILNTCPNSRVCSFPATAGASSVIDRMDIYSLANGQLLESLTNYSLWSSLENQYCEEDNAHSQLKNGTDVEPRAYSCVQTAGTDSDPDNSKKNVLTERGYVGDDRSTLDLGSMIFSQISSGTGVVSGADQNADMDSEMCAKKFAARKFCIPLKSGIFSHFGVSEKLTPILLFGGLRVEITFAEDKRVMTRLNIASGATLTSVVKADSFANGLPVANLEDGKAAGAGVGARDLRTILITGTQITDPATLGIVRGSKMTAQGTGGSGAQNFTVNSVHRELSQTDGTPSATGAITLTVTADATAGGTKKLAASTGVKIFFQNDSTQSTYKLKNVELKVLQVIPPQGMMKGMIKESQFDYISWDCFLDNLPQTSLSHQSDITSVASAAKSIFTHYISVNTENEKYGQNYYNGQPPHRIFLDSVQYFINNKLYPLKAYNPSAKQDKVVNMNELVKAFKTLGKDVKRLGECRAGNICDYTNTYLHARELARGEQFVYNLKDAEPQIRLTFNKGRDQVIDGAAAGNVRMIHFVFSVKTIMINKDNLQLIL